MAGPSTYRFRSMGTGVSVVLPGSQRREALRVQRLFADWDARLSRFRPDSELSGVNAAAGRPVRVSPTTLAVVAAGLAAARATDGRFDPLLGTRLVELGYDRTFEALPLEGTAGPTDGWLPGRWRQVELDERNLTIRVPRDTALDLGGIAKGMAVDAALAELASTGVAYAAVDAGGDLAVFGELPGEAGWPIAVEGLPGAVAIMHGGLATSSVLRRRWRAGGHERHHLLDARSGLPAEGDLVQVTVTAASCRQAEIAAKAAILSTADEATAFALRHGLAAAFLTAGGDVLRVGNWQ